MVVVVVVVVLVVVVVVVELCRVHKKGTTKAFRDLWCNREEKSTHFHGGVTHEH